LIEGIALRAELKLRNYVGPVYCLLSTTYFLNNIMITVSTMLAMIDDARGK
jgi:hypothetical protein